MGKKIAALIVLLLVVAGLAVAGVLVLAPNSSISKQLRAVTAGAADELADYLGRQVVAIANGQLVPDLAYESLNYDAPYTLTLKGVTLTAPDSTQVLDIDELTVTLAEIPEMGKPIRIAKLTIDGGRINAIVDPESGGLRGLSPIVESSGERESVSSDLKLSNVLELDRIDIKDVDMRYQDAAGEEMVIEGFEAGLDIVPAGDDAAGESGWYTLAFTSGRKPGLQLDVNGRVNIDSWRVELERVIGALTLDESTVSSLPPQLGTIAKEHDAQGEVKFNASGALNLMDPMTGDLTSTVEISGFNVASGDYRLPIETGNAEIAMSGGVLRLNSMTLNTLQGVVSAGGEVTLSAPDQPARLNWSAERIDLQAALRTRQSEGATPPLAGTFTSSGSATTALADVTGRMSGSGTVSIAEGRFVEVPVLGEIVRALASAAGIVGIGNGQGTNSSLNADFNLTGQGIDVTQSELATPALAARATGLIGYDGTLNMRVNAGPIEKLQSKLGDVGKILGAVTDKLVTYAVKGTVSEPKVSVQPLGVGG